MLKIGQSKNAIALFMAVLAAMFAPAAFAQSAFDPLTTGVSFVDAIAAVMAVAAILAALYTTLRGVVLILGFIRRG